MTPEQKQCPQCATVVEQLHEGYCEQCCNENQAALDRHNFEYDYWNRMDNERREEAIRRAYQ
jgi:glutaredoxin-related protein